MAVATLFSSPEMAEGYARHRPPVHSHILALALAPLPAPRSILDVGCGAGLSTRPLLHTRATVHAVDPFPEMTSWARRLAPGAHYCTAASEHLPYPNHSFDLITAAGSLNFTRLPQALAEIARTLTPDGHLLLYDFSQGAEIAGNPALDHWHTAFKLRYPSPPSPEFDPETLPYASAGLQLLRLEPFAIPIELTAALYLEYALTETNVAAALSRGISRSEIRGWCELTLAPVFAGHPADVVFRGYYAIAKPLAA